MKVLQRLLTVGVVLSLVGCAADEGPQPLKVAIVGLDGATWSVIDPLLEAGELPNMARLLERGARGTLRARAPIKSPALWTTIATGRPRNVHGIRDFQQNGQLVSAQDRKVPAIWQWVSAFDRTVGFSGWWASWPVDPVNGWFITDRAVRSRWGEWTNSSASERTTHPESLVDTVRRTSVVPADLTREGVAEIVELNDAEWDEFVAAEKPIFHHWLSVFKFSFANQLSYENISLDLLADGQPDLFGVFLIANDPISHTFWHFYQPEKYKSIDAEQAARLGNAVPNIYRHNDRYIGRLLEMLDEDTVVVVLSDHGFQASGIVPRGVSRERYDELAGSDSADDMVAIGQSGKHHSAGIMLLSGPGILPGTEFTARQVDVAPTVMALMGLPVAEELNGEVLSEVLDATIVPEVQTISSYAPLVSSVEGDTDLAVEDPEMLERLRALGYVD